MPPFVSLGICLEKGNGIWSDLPIQINSVLDTFQSSILYSPQNPHMAWMPCAVLVLPRTAGPAGWGHSL